VEKTCCVPPPTSSSGDDCKGKVTELVLQYSPKVCETNNSQEGKAKCSGENPGEAPITVTATGKDAGELYLNGYPEPTTLDDLDILGNDLVSFTRPGGKDGELKASTKFEVEGSGGAVQSLEIHTSCSKPLNVGDYFGSMKVVQLTTTNGGTVTLPDPDAPERSACVTVGEPIGTECDSRATEIVFEYIGEKCADPLQNTQEGKAECVDTDPDPFNPLPDDVIAVFTGKDAWPPESPVSLYGTFRLTGTGGKEGYKLPADTTLDIIDPASGDLLLQDLKIHTSCSKPLALGDVFGSLKVVEFSTENGETFVSAGEPPLNNECEVVAVAPPEPHCTSKIEVLSLRYRAENCQDPLDNPQPGKDDVPKATCEDLNGWLGELPSDAEVKIVVIGTGGKDGDITYLDTGFDPPVSEGDIVHAMASTAGKSAFGSESIVEIWARDDDANETMVQELHIHTSCSKPLNLGDRFGALEVFSMDLQEGGLVSQGSTVEYQYKVTNPNATTVDNITVDDDQLGVIASGISLDAGKSRTFFKTALISEETTNTVTVTGGVGGSSVCFADDTLTVTVTEPDPPPAGSCEDGDRPYQLEFEYTGDDCSEGSSNSQKGFDCFEPETPIINGVFPVQIVPVGKDGKDPGYTVYPGLLSPPYEQPVTFTATGSRLKAESWFKVVQTEDGNEQELQFVKMHTSCSQPLIVGDEFGSLILKGFIPETP